MRGIWKIGFVPLAAGLLFCAAPVWADTYTWTGASDVNWNSSANWNPTGTPTAFADRAAFNAAPTRQPTVNGSLSVGWVDVTGGLGWTWSGSGPLTIGSVFTYSSSGSSTFNPVLAGTGSLTVTSGTLSLPAANTYSGGTTLDGGTLWVGNNALGSGTFTINGGTVTCNGATLTNAVVVNGNTQFSQSGQTLTLNGPVTLNNAVTFYVGVGMGFTLNLGGAVTDNGYGLTLTGPGNYGGTANFNVNNATTLTGGITANGGTGLTLGAGANNAFGTGTVTIASDGVYLSGNGVSLGNNWKLLRNFIYNASAQSCTLNGNIVMGGNYTLAYGGGYSDTITFNGNFINDGSGTYTVSVSDWNGGGQTFNLAGSGKTHQAGVKVGANITFNITGSNNTFAQPLTLNGATITVNGTNNTFNGGVTVNAGTMQINTTNSFAGVVVIRSGSLQVASSGAMLGGTVAMRPLSPWSMPVLGLGVNMVPAMDPSSRDGVIAINTAGFNAITNLAALGDGAMWLGSSSSGTFAGTSLGVGSGSTYRLGGGGGTLTLDAPGAGVLTGANKVEIGRKGGGGNYSGTVVLSDANDFTGALTVNRGSTLTGIVQPNGGGSPFGSATGVVTNNAGTLALSSPGGSDRQPISKGATSFSGAATISLTGGTTTYPISLTLDSVVPDPTYKSALLFKGLNFASSALQHNVFVTNRGADLTPNPTNGTVSSRYLGWDGGSHWCILKWDNAKGLVRYTDADYKTWATAGQWDLVNGGGTVDAPITVWGFRLGGNITGTGSITCQGGYVSGYAGQNNIAVPVDFGSANGVVACEIGSNGELQFSSNILGSDGITKVGANNVHLSAVSRSLTGPVTVLAGRLNVASSASVTLSQALGASGNDPVVLNGGAFGLNYHASGVAFTRPITVAPNGGTVAKPGYGGTVYLDGPITGSGPLALWFDAGGGSTTGLRCPTNTYSGGTLIYGYYADSSGVSVDSVSSLGSGDVTLVSGAGAFLTLNGRSNMVATAKLSIHANGTVNMTQGGQTYDIAGLSGFGTVALGPASGSGTTTLRLGGDGSSTEFYGTIRNGNASASGYLIKAGTGAFLMNGTMASGSGGVTNMAGTLGGSGTISRSVTITDGSVLAPGDSGIGTLTVGDLTLLAGCTSLFDIGTTNASDKIVVNGNLTLAGTLSVTNAPTFVGKGMYPIITYTGVLTDNGTTTTAFPGYKARVEPDSVAKIVWLNVIKRTGFVVFIK